MKRDLIKPAGIILLAGVGMLVLLSACTVSASGTTPVQAAPEAPATAKPAAVPVPAAPSTSAPAPAAAAPPPASPAPDGAASNDLLAKGKLIFEKTAGGVGCAYCHGLDGRGQGPAGMAAANIRGKNKTQIKAAIAGGVPMMGMVKHLTDEEITAVAAYLQQLEKQP